MVPKKVGTRFLSNGCNGSGLLFHGSGPLFHGSGPFFHGSGPQFHGSGPFFCGSWNQRSVTNMAGNQAGSAHGGNWKHWARFPTNPFLSNASASQTARTSGISDALRPGFARAVGGAGRPAANWRTPSAARTASLERVICIRLRVSGAGPGATYGT